MYKVITSKDIVLGLVQACNPVSIGQIKNELREQSLTVHNKEEATEQAEQCINELIKEGKVIISLFYGDNDICIDLA